MHKLYNKLVNKKIKTALEFDLKFSFVIRKTLLTIK